MSQTVDQIYIANPTTVLAGTDLFYLVNSPYAPGNDSACTWSTIMGSLPSATWIDVASATQTLAKNTGYITDNGASLVTYTLPATCAQGGIIEVAGKSSGGWLIAQLAGQQIFLGNQQTTLGATGSIASTNLHDYVKLLCITANTTKEENAKINRLFSGKGAASS